MKLIIHSLSALDCPNNRAALFDRRLQRTAVLKTIVEGRRARSITAGDQIQIQTEIKKYRSPQRRKKA